jgi:rifampicin phosphotransferase
LLHLVMQALPLPVLQWACRRWLKELGPTGGQRLFAGLGGIAVAEAGLGLWRLALLARGEAQTEAVLAGDASWAEIRRTLQGTEHGRKFVGAWDQFMTEHGHHGRGELELYNARWAETPDYVLGLVRNYLRCADHLNPLANQQRLADERRRLTEQCRCRLKNPIKRWVFSSALRRAQKAALNREEWKNQVVRQFAAMRRALLRLGKLLQQQGVLADGDDIFFLEVAEIEAMGAGDAALDLRERIRARREEYTANLRLHPQPAVFGRSAPKSRPRPQTAAGVNVLEGIAVSPGVVTGRARLVLRSDNHAQVLPGEILVVPFTDPAWTPYFVSAAGVVMDQGGVLSHGSIVAREYGLPAVTSLGSATQLIRTGDLIQVDGDGGRVTILERGG